MTPQIKKDVFIVAALILVVLLIPVSAFFILPKTSHASTPVTEPIQSTSGYYLSYSNNATKIFVVSANASYGSYPYPTVTYPPFANPSNGVIAQNGEACVIINVTIRDDYSAQNPAPNPYPGNSTVVFVRLMAEIFNGKNQINAADITNANWVASAGTNGAFTSINNGESTSVTIYLATNQKDVTNFQLTTGYVGGIPPP